ncbi:PP2C family protein-serine/threonine phosphatase [Nocardioides sp.]|uniref:PP2C family protein-serine/threonine phosphatase n=1 Tax=Nocardioides sp. TaxID=35761 RepID=UPI0037847B27
MSISVRERHARLLADSRSSEPRARLAQAVSRAEFLLRASRSVSAVQNPQRALEALVALLLDDLVDVAGVVVRSGAWQLSTVGTQGAQPHSQTSRWVVDGSPSAIEQVLRSSVAEEVALPASGPGRARVLRSLLADEDAVAQVDSLGVEQLVALPLGARGRSFGVLVLGRGQGFGFGESHGFLDDLAERVAVGLDATLVVAESRYVAGVLRRSLAPDDLPEIPDLDLATFYRVAHESEDVGGDFLDVHGPHDDVLVLCGDVAGKGVEAAVHAKRIRNAVRTASFVDRRPGWVLGLVNQVVVAEAGPDDESLATATCLRLRHREGRFEVDVANAGHPPALLLRADGEVTEVTAGGIALGLLEGSDYDETTVHLAPGDTLLLHTDGVTEARGAEGMFGDDRLRAALAGMGGLPARSVVDAVAIAVTDHLGDRPHDDIALVAVQHRPGREQAR